MKANDYITCHDAIRALQMNFGDYYGARRALCEIPAADVAPVVHGRWIKTDHGNDTLLASCSQCNYPVDWWRGKTKYCPNCGAKMDGDE